jgi:hypothetical protein
MAAKRLATPDDVRAWARTKGLPIKDRGRISFELAEAFNKDGSNRNKYVPASGAKAPKTVTVERLKPGQFKVSTMRVTNGRKVPVRKTVKVTEVRSALVAAGHEVPTKGRLSDKHFETFVSLGLQTA